MRSTFQGLRRSRPREPLDDSGEPLDSSGEPVRKFVGSICSKRCWFGTCSGKDQDAVLGAEVEAVVEAKLEDELLQLAEGGVGVGVNVDREVAVLADKGG